MLKKTFSVELGGKTLTAEFSDLADQANGSVILRYGKTVVLATATMGQTERHEIDYFPLTVDYEERFYAAGQILGSRFMRREGRPSEEAILSGRIVDRTIRPLFNHHLRNEVQVVLTILSIDEDDPDVLGVIAASLALGVSDIPWDGPVSAVRIGKKKGGEVIINPTYVERAFEDYHYDVLACGKDGSINMIEIASDEASEHEILEALREATRIHTTLGAWQQEIIAEIGKEKKTVTHLAYADEIIAHFNEHAAAHMSAALITGEPGKAGIKKLKDEWLAKVAVDIPDFLKRAGHYFEEKVDEQLHSEATANGRRPDGRAMDEVRPLFALAGDMSPMAHGTGVFYRGGTHVFTALTLGGPGDSQIVDSIEHQDESKRFMHHYNFPPFSSGETGRLGGVNRRAVGHGALAEKALLPMIPKKEDFPYTIRLVSECMASNGSTSMASTCASTLALMDGGVPIKRPVAGIAMGLMLHGSTYKVLTDIQGPEDHHGDMDFKVAGTTEGITAAQMDVKVGGIPLSILEEALTGAKKARLHILETMRGAISAPREDISPLAPKIIALKVRVDQIGLVIGPGGKTINGIKDRTGVTDITIEDDGSVFITGKDGTAELARDEIASLTHVYTAGERYEGEVVRLMDFGAFVKIGKNAEGLVHISEIAPFRIQKVEDVLSVGEVVPVIIREIDEKERINLSIKMADPEFAQRKGINPDIKGTSTNGSN